jgi:hypothetical protein
MHRPTLKLLVRSCISIAASVALISSVGVTPATAAESYTPTMKDMLSIQGAIERYLKGFDTHDLKLQEAAFWDDAVITSPRGQKMPFKQALGPPMPPPGAAGDSGAPPSGASAAPGPPPATRRPKCPQRGVSFGTSLRILRSSS